MNTLKPYRHERTGKIGEYSDAVAALFPELKPLDAEAEPAPAAEAPVVDPTPKGARKAAAEHKEEEAE